MTTLESILKGMTQKDEPEEETGGVDAQALLELLSQNEGGKVEVDPALIQALLNQKPKPVKKKGSTLSDFMAQQFGDRVEEEVDLEAMFEFDEEFVRPNGERYYPRPVMGGVPDLAILRKARERAQHVMMSGYPGTGKTAAAEAAFGMDLISVQGSQGADISDFIGSWVPVGGSPVEVVEDETIPATTEAVTGIGYRWVWGPLHQAMTEGRPLFIDDFTLIPPGVLSRIYPAMDGRRCITVPEYQHGEEIHAVDGFMVVAAHNPGALAAMLDDAMKSRFAFNVELSTDYSIAAKELKVSSALTAVARSLSERRSKGEIDWAPEMRELIAASNIAKDFGMEFAIINLLQNAPRSQIGIISDAFRKKFPHIDFEEYFNIPTAISDKDED